MASYSPTGATPRDHDKHDFLAFRRFIRRFMSGQMAAAQEPFAAPRIVRSHLITYTKAQAVMKQKSIMASSPHAFARSIQVTRNEFSSIADAPPAGALPPTFC